MKYIVLEGDRDALTKQVNEYISQGWRSQGGVASKGHYDTLYQAMIREQYHQPS